MPGAKVSFHEVRIRLFWQRRHVEFEELRGSYHVLLDAIPDVVGQSGRVPALAAAMVSRSRGRAALRTWIAVIRLANRLGRSDAPASLVVPGAMAVVWCAVLGETVDADDAVEAIDNLGFDLDDSVTGHDLAFLSADAVRGHLAAAGPDDLEAARASVGVILGYADTLAYIGRRTDRSLRWPALTVLARRLLADCCAVPAAFVPFALSARRSFLSQDPGWERTLEVHVARAEACVSLLRALPARLHRYVPVDGRPVPRTPASRQRALLAAVGAWAAAHPDQRELIAPVLPAGD